MNPNQCSFCGRQKKDVEMLVAGQQGYICEHCIEQAHAIVKESLKPAGFVPADSMDDLKRPRCV